MHGLSISPALSDWLWSLRRRVWNAVATAKFARNRPSKVPGPTEEPPLFALPFVSQFPTIPVFGLVVGDRIPRDEYQRQQRLQRLVSRVQVGLSRLLPPMQGGLPPIPDDPCEALKGAYTNAHWRRFRAPRRPPEYADGIDLGRLAVASPYASYVATNGGDGMFRWDLSVLEGFEFHPGLRSPAVVVDFRLDPLSRQLEAIRIDSELGCTGPDDPRWSEAARLAMCAVTTHTSLVRHFNWIHLVAGGPLAIVTRNELPADHYVRRLLWPHVYGTQSSNQVVTPPQLIRGGDFETIFSYTHRGLCHLFEATADDFDLRMIDPATDASRRRIAEADLDTPALDNRLELMDVLRAHASRYLALYYDDAALAGDDAFRRWLEELVRAVPGAAQLAGFDVGGVTVAGATKLISTLIYLVTVEHEVVGSGLWDYQLWSDLQPVRVYRNAARPPLDVYQRLVNANYNLNVDRTKLMSDFSRLAVDREGVAALDAFRADLQALQSKLERQPAACWRIEPKVLKANINA